MIKYKIIATKKDDMSKHYFGEYNDLKTCLTCMNRYIIMLGSKFRFNFELVND